MAGGDEVSSKEVGANEVPEEWRVWRAGRSDDAARRHRGAARSGRVAIRSATLRDGAALHIKRRFIAPATSTAARRSRVTPATVRSRRSFDLGPIARLDQADQTVHWESDVALASAFALLDEPPRTCYVAPMRFAALSSFALRGEEGAEEGADAAADGVGASERGGGGGGVAVMGGVEQRDLSKQSVGGACRVGDCSKRQKVII